MLSARPIVEFWRALDESGVAVPAGTIATVAAGTVLTVTGEALM